jgi:negative regulator of sigma E activity
MRKFSTILVTAVLLLANAAQAADDPAARKLLDAVMDKNAAGFQAGQSKTALTLRLASGKEKTWLTLARVVRKDGKMRSRITFLQPAEDAGVELLMLEQGKNQAAQQFLWLPKTRRLRRIGGSQRNAAFMDTDFSFGDLDSHAMQGGETKKLGAENVGTVPCTRVEVTTPDPDEAYAKVELWIDEKLSVPRKMTFYAKDGKLLKTLTVDVVDTIDGRATLKKFHMQNHVRGSTTTVETKEIDTKVALPDAAFQPEALGQ